MCVYTVKQIVNMFVGGTKMINVCLLVVQSTCTRITEFFPVLEEYQRLLECLFFPKLSAFSLYLLAMLSTQLYQHWLIYKSQGDHNHL